MRRKTFFILDRFKGSPVKKNLDDLTSFFDNTYDLNEFLSFQKERLSNIIIYSIDNVSFYKNYNIDFLKFPVIDKFIVRNNLNNFISKEFDKEQLKEVVTSGSTGLPFKVFHNKAKEYRNSADAIKFGEIGGFNFGTTLAYLKIWNNFNNKSNFIKYIQNILPINVVNLSDQSIEKLINKLNRMSSLSILGYASAIETISESVKRNNFDLKVKFNSIITMSEGISLESRNQIQKTLNCPVYARYSNVENGIIAQQISMDSDMYLINSSSYYVEILSFDKDCSVKKGQIGRIVVTDFFNNGMPMIRYDTGDIGSKIVITENGKTKEFLTNVEGRKMDAIYNTKGELVSSFIITNGMWKYSELLQYQFIQKSNNEYFFKLNCTNGFEREGELKNDFISILGSNALIGFEYVNDIPLLSSGKRKKVINLIK